MIVVKLFGGLGNQMFQYAFGKALALKNKTILKLDTNHLLDRSHNNHTHRSYELGIFNIYEEIACSKDLKKFEFKKSILRKILEILSNIFIFKVLNENGFNFNDYIFKEKSNLYLSGYWQSEKYFFDFEKEIRQSFSFKEAPSFENDRILKKIKDTCSVGIHIRRGDFVTLKSANEFHGTCSIDYYNKAIEFIASKESTPFFYIFSDEPDWVKENFKINYPSIIISHNTGNSSFEDLRLMSSCKHNIIANSSFSWWGAWLNTHKEKIVIAPEKWFLDSTINTSDLIPNMWIKI